MAKRATRIPPALEQLAPLHDWSAGFITGLTAGLARLFGAIPNIIGALLLLVIGWIIAGIVGNFVAKLCAHQRRRRAAACE